MPGAATNALQELASLYGVQTAYYGVDHKRRPASTESLLAVLMSLGAPVEGLRSVPEAVRQRQQDLWRRLTEPVVVAWDGRPNLAPVRIPAAACAGRWEARLELEDGEIQEWLVVPSKIEVLKRSRLENEEYITKPLVLPHSLPLGYHRLHLEIPGTGTAESLIISAPLKAVGWEDAPNKRGWGVFLPLYALHSDRTPDTGDFTSLAELAEWAAGLGGSMVGTLPLLATYLDKPFDPSPYSPASRLMWNEFYLDTYDGADAVSGMSSLPDVLDSVQAMAKAPEVDYRETAALKRRLLESQAAEFFSKDSPQREEYLRYSGTHPEVELYAKFRAIMDRQQGPWQHWPSRLRNGEIHEGDFDIDACSYHKYAQWLAAKQMDSLTSRAERCGVSMYLDLPLGVHPAGYDTWRWPELFAHDIQAGAPPDLFSTDGQLWGFPPLNPQRMREDRYDYVIRYLRHHLRHADVLRFDHVMGLHRLFWVPRSMEDARQGVYVRYPDDELHAILTLESKRHNTVMIGEDLGVVPRYVRSAMAKHGIRRMYVSYFEMNPDSGLGKVPPNSLACLNTHDMAPFSGFLDNTDLDYRIKSGLLDPQQGEDAIQNRTKAAKALRRFLVGQGLIQQECVNKEELLRAVLVWLARSSAPVVLVNLEDLWLETQSQNVPGTEDDFPNWRRKSRYSFEEFSHMPQVLESLSEIDRARNGRES